MLLPANHVTVITDNLGHVTEIAPPPAGPSWRQLAVGDRVRSRPVSHYRIALPQKSLPGWQFTRKNSPRPAAAWARRIFTGKLSAGGDFSGGRSYNGDTFYGAGDILIRGDISFPWLSFPGRMFHGGRHCNVTPADITGLWHVRLCGDYTSVGAHYMAGASTQRALQEHEYNDEGRRHPLPCPAGRSSWRTAARSMIDELRVTAT